MEDDASLLGIVQLESVIASLREQQKRDAETIRRQDEELTQLVNELRSRDAHSHGLEQTHTQTLVTWQRERTELQRRADDAERRASKLEMQMEQLHSKVTSTQESTTQLQVQVKTLQEEKRHLQDQLSKTKHEAEQSQQLLRELYDSMIGMRAREDGHIETIKSLEQQRDQLQQQLRQLRHKTQEQTDTIKSLEAARAKLQSRIEDETRQHEMTKQALSQTHAKLTSIESDCVRLQHEIAPLAAREQRREQLLALAQTREHRMQQEIDALKRALMGNSIHVPETNARPAKQVSLAHQQARSSPSQSAPDSSHHAAISGVVKQTSATLEHHLNSEHTRLSSLLQELRRASKLPSPQAVTTRTSADQEPNRLPHVQSAARGQAGTSANGSSFSTSQPSDMSRPMEQHDDVTTPASLARQPITPPSNLVDMDDEVENVLRSSAAVLERVKHRRTGHIDGNVAGVDTNDVKESTTSTSNRDEESAFRLRPRSQQRQGADDGHSDTAQAQRVRFSPSLTSTSSSSHQKMARDPASSSSDHRLSAEPSNPRISSTAAAVSYHHRSPSSAAGPRSAHDIQASPAIPEAKLALAEQLYERVRQQLGLSSATAE